jgi:hypothetical protein
MNVNLDDCDEDSTCSAEEWFVSSSSTDGVVEEVDGSSMAEDSDVVDDGSEASDGSVEVYEEAKDEVPCEFCGQVPCHVENSWDNICEICDYLKDNGMANNQVRFHAYREYTRLKHGVLRMHDRRPLPICVRSEILDSWPGPTGTYVGFQAAIKHAAEDSD